MNIQRTPEMIDNLISVITQDLNSNNWSSEQRAVYTNAIARLLKEKESLEISK